MDRRKSIPGSRSSTHCTDHRNRRRPIVESLSDLRLNFVQRRGEGEGEEGQRRRVRHAMLRDIYVQSYSCVHGNFYGGIHENPLARISTLPARKLRNPELVRG